MFKIPWRGRQEAGGPAGTDNKGPGLKETRVCVRRPFYQGQLDFFCAVYAVLNALALTCDIGISEGRRILAETLQAVSARPALWRAVLHNETDFDWLTRYILATQCAQGRLALKVLRPAGAGFFLWQAGAEDRDLRNVSLHLDPSAGRPPFSSTFTLGLNEFWQGLQAWLPEAVLDPDGGPAYASASGPAALPSGGRSSGPRRAVVLRFKKFMHPSATPLITHWTTGRAFAGLTLLLFDATPDPSATHDLTPAMCAIRREDLDSDGGASRTILIEPETVYLVERAVGPAANW